jgi:hypothetical protein
MDNIEDEAELSTVPSLGSSDNNNVVNNIHVIGQVAALSSINTIFYLQMLLLMFNHLPTLNKRKGRKRRREANVHRA